MLLGTSGWISEILFNILKNREKPSRTKNFWDLDVITAKLKQH